MHDGNDLRMYGNQIAYNMEYSWILFYARITQKENTHKSEKYSQKPTKKKRAVRVIEFNHKCVGILS